MKKKLFVIILQRKVERERALSFQILVLKGLFIPVHCLIWLKRWVQISHSILLHFKVQFSFIWNTYRIYSRISREILDKKLTLNCQLDLYAGHKNVQYLYGNDSPLSIIVCSSWEGEGGRGEFSS